MGREKKRREFLNKYDPLHRFDGGVPDSYVIEAETKVKVDGTKEFYFARCGDLSTLIRMAAMMSMPVERI